VTYSRVGTANVLYIQLVVI